MCCWEGGELLWTQQETAKVSETQVETQAAKEWTIEADRRL